MRRFILPVALVVIAGWAFAQDAPATQTAPAKDTQTAAPAKDSQTATDAKVAGEAMTAMVVSTDATAKTITVKKEDLSGRSEPERTLIVDGKALTSLKTVQAGQKVTLFVKKDANGKELVTTIEASKPTAAPKE